MGTEDMTHGYWWYDSWVLHILTGTEDMTHGYWGYDSRVLMIWLTGTAYPHGYWGYDSRVLRIWLTGTAYPHRYWGYDSRVLMIWLTGNAYPHGYWGYDSQVLMIWLTGNAYPHGYCIPSQVLHIVYTGCISLSPLTYQPRSNFKQETAMFKASWLNTDSGCLFVISQFRWTSLPTTVTLLKWVKTALLFLHVTLKLLQLKL